MRPLQIRNAPGGYMPAVHIPQLTQPAATSRASLGSFGFRGCQSRRLVDSVKDAFLLMFHHGRAGFGVQVVPRRFNFHLAASEQFGEVVRDFGPPVQDGAWRSRQGKAQDNVKYNNAR